jgi:hypothetical protein
MANNPLTLVTAAKYLPNVMASGVVELFALNSSILQQLPIEYSDNPTRYDYQREKTIADAAWRILNADVETTHSELEDATEKIFPLAIKIPMDNALKKGDSNRLITQQTMGAVKGMASKFTTTFFAGDNSLYNEPDGLNVRLANYSQAAAIATNGLNVLGSAANAQTFITKLENMIGDVDEPTTGNGKKAWLMSLTTKLVLDQAINLTGYYLSTNNKDTGIADPTIGSFAGIPIIVVSRDKDGAEILGFTETEGTSTTQCSSIYLVNFSTDDGIHIITPRGETDVLNPTIKEYTTGGLDYYHLELSLGLVMRKARSAYRLKGIKKA